MDTTVSTLFGTYVVPDERPLRERLREKIRAAAGARDRAIKAVDSGSDPRDLGTLLLAAERVVASRAEFTTEDVWEAAGGRESVRGDGRLMGAVMRRLAKAGLCEATDRVRPSGSPVNHHRPIRVWRSLAGG